MRPALPANALINPDFTSGSSSGWILQSGWSIGVAGRPDGTTGENAVFTGPGSGSVTNNTRINCIPGGVVKAQCWALGEPSATGNAALQIAFYDVNNNLLVLNNSPWITNNYVWQLPTMRCVAPSFASYAMISFAVYNSLGGPRWFCNQFYGAYLLGSVGRTQLTVKQPMQYYLNLFTSQYKLSPKLNQWQTALMTPLDDLTNCVQTFNVAYDIDNAIGNQLDVLGQIIGVSRTLPFQPSNSVSPVLDDDTYRLLLYATQIRNTWDGTIESLYQGWEFLFPNGLLTIVDNQNMTATITASGTFSSIQNDLITHGYIVPRPEGVQYNYGGTGVGLFGFDRNDSSISGFDIGVFA